MLLSQLVITLLSVLVYEIGDLENYAILTNSLAPIREEFKEERFDEV